MSPRFVHLFGNWKWTGPAELVLEMVRALGPQAELLLGECPFPDLAPPVFQHATRLGLDVRSLKRLRKHFNPILVPAASRELVEVLSTHTSLELLHVHFDSDHAVASRAREKLQAAPALVRSVHEPPPHPSRRRRLLRTRSELALAPTRELAADLEEDLGWESGSVGVLPPGVDLQRFHPRDDAWRRAGRARLGISNDAFVIGIVARVQRHRRFDLLIDTWARMKADPNAPHLVVLGRGTAIEELLLRPVRELGLGHRIHTPGYQEGDAYLECLCACDAGLYLVPGSDVTCRAVREWMAMGRGVMTTKRAPLPELVRDGTDGAFFEESPESLMELLVSPDRQRQWERRGSAAAERAKSEFSRDRIADLLHCYYDLASLARPGSAQRWRRTAQALAVVRPGSVPAAVRWAQQEGVGASELIVADPRRSRDIGIDTLALLNRSGAQRVLLQPYPEWERSVIEEIQVARSLRTSLLVDRRSAGSGTLGAAQENAAESRWMWHSVQHHWADDKTEAGAPARLDRS